LAGAIPEALAAGLNDFPDELAGRMGGDWIERLASPDIF
jgi:hypothetical protein